MVAEQRCRQLCSVSGPSAALVELTVSAASRSLRQQVMRYLADRSLTYCRRSTGDGIALCIAATERPSLKSAHSPGRPTVDGLSFKLSTAKPTLVRPTMSPERRASPPSSPPAARAVDSHANRHWLASVAFDEVTREIRAVTSAPVDLLLAVSHTDSGLAMGLGSVSYQASGLRQSCR